MTKCGPCGKLFTGTSAFDLHRTGRHQPLERRCLSTHEMEALGMTMNAKGEWGRELTDASRARLAALRS